MNTENAVRHIAKLIKDDEGYRWAWHTNITTSIQNSFYRKGVSGRLVYYASQEAAESFLDNLISRFGGEGVNNDKA